jgi:hypothetical protein
MFERFRVALLSLVAVPVGIAGLAATAEAGTITLHRDQTKYTSDIGGGEFGATAFDGLAVSTSPMRMNNFSGVQNTVFQTFCIEGNNSTISNDVPMNWSLSTGINGVGSITSQTAYLFTQFWNGNLYSGAEGQLGATRISNAKDLQEALWYLEGFWIGGFSSLTAGAQTMVNNANSAVSGGSWSGIGDVRVLVLTNATTGAALQDVLVLLTVPLPPAALLGLALIGGLGVAGVVRRRRQSVVS